ncbi:MAG: hypothetical protein AAF394_06400 [Planctomycetota bacterium]
MAPDKFLQLRESDWKALDGLLKQATERPESLSTADAERLGTLYRAATSDLAIAKRDYPKVVMTEPAATDIRRLGQLGQWTYSGRSSCN